MGHFTPHRLLLVRVPYSRDNACAAPRVGCVPRIGPQLCDTEFPPQTAFEFSLERRPSPRNSRPLSRLTTVSSAGYHAEMRRGSVPTCLRFLLFSDHETGEPVNASFDYCGSRDVLVLKSLSKSLKAMSDEIEEEEEALVHCCGGLFFVQQLLRFLGRRGRRRHSSD